MKSNKDITFEDNSNDIPEYEIGEEVVGKTNYGEVISGIIKATGKKSGSKKISSFLIENNRGQLKWVDSIVSSRVVFTEDGAQLSF